MSNQCDCILTVILSSERLKNILFLVRKRNSSHVLNMCLFWVQPEWALYPNSWTWTVPLVNLGGTCEPLVAWRCWVQLSLAHWLVFLLPLVFRWEFVFPCLALVLKRTVLHQVCCGQWLGDLDTAHTIYLPFVKPDSWKENPITAGREFVYMGLGFIFVLLFLVLAL